MKDIIKLSKKYFSILKDVEKITISASKTLIDKVPIIVDIVKPSTDIDKSIDEFLSKELHRLVQAPILSEESGMVINGNSEVLWIIDPVDGTLNAISGSPDVAISVALTTKDFAPIISVVVAPFYGKTYTACAGNGAFCNNKKLVISPDRRFPKTIAIGLPSDAKSRSKIIGSQIQQLIEGDWIIRQSGAAALDICRVAEGNWLAFVEDGLYLWDIAGANLIAQEAGCISHLKAEKLKQDVPNYRCSYLTACNETFAESVKKIFQ